jgi:hypothetical protein
VERRSTEKREKIILTGHANEIASSERAIYKKNVKILLFRNNLILQLEKEKEIQ